MSAESEKIWSGVVKVLIAAVTLVVALIVAGVVITSVKASDSKLPSCNPYEVIVGSGDYDAASGEWDTYTCKPVAELQPEGSS